MRLDDVLGNDPGVLTHAVKDRRLALPHPVHAHEVEARHAGPSIRLDREPHLIDDRELHPSVIRTVAAGPDDASDSVASDVQLGTSLDAKWRRHLDRWRSGSIGRAIRLDELQEVAQPGVAKIDAGGEVVGKMERGTIDSDIPSKQLDTHRVQHA